MFSHKKKKIICMAVYAHIQRYDYMYNYYMFIYMFTQAYITHFLPHSKDALL